MPKTPTFPNLPQPSPNFRGKVRRTFPKPPPIGGRGKVRTPALRKHPKTVNLPQTIKVTTLHELHLALQTGHPFTIHGGKP